MASWWMASNPDVVAVPSGEFEPDSVRARRFLDREQVLPGPSGRIRPARLAEVLAALGDIDPLSLYETMSEDVTALCGPSVHCYFRPDDDVVVESVAPDGWRRFSFVPERYVVARLVLGLATIWPSEPGRLVACTLADGHDSVLVSDGMDVLLGDLPEGRGPVQNAVSLAAEDVQVLLRSRLREVALA